MAVSFEVKIRVARDPRRPTYHGETTFSLETELAQGSWLEGDRGTTCPSSLVNPFTADFVPRQLWEAVA